MLNPRYLVICFIASLLILYMSCATKNRTIKIVKMDETGANLLKQTSSVTPPLLPTPTYASTPPSEPTVVSAIEEALMWQFISTYTTTQTFIATATPVPTKKKRKKIPLPSNTYTKTITCTPSPEPTALPFKVIHNSAFGVGEKLVYAVQYMGVTAGYATLEVQNIVSINGYRAFHITTTAQTTPFFSKFFKVDDKIESFVDVDYIFSHRFNKKLSEGKYRPKPQHWIFDQANKIVTDNDGKITQIQPDTQDILSAFYYFRTIQQLENSSVAIPVYADGKNYELVTKILRKEIISVPVGAFNSVVIEPQLKFEGLFQQKGKITIWVTDDKRRVPLQVKSKIIIGSVDMVLQDATVVDIEE